MQAKKRLKPLIIKSKAEYYSNKFDQVKGNSRKTRQTINEIITNKDKTHKN